MVLRRNTAGVRCRLYYNGGVHEDLDEEGSSKPVAISWRNGVSRPSQCAFFTYRNPDHERRTASILRQAFPGVTVSISTDISREYREYERTSTAVLDAYIRPIFERYIAELNPPSGVVDLLAVSSSCGLAEE